MIPDNFFDKLVVGPTFYTDIGLRRLFEGPAPNFSHTRRQIDLHARFDVNGTDWYRRMRERAFEAIKDVRATRSVRGGLVGTAQYLAEMRHSKLCMSPFGYGEVCWRDFEAFGSGAVLIKPDISNVEVAIDCFQAGRTYVPIGWTFDDAATSIEKMLVDSTYCEEMATNAFNCVADYFRERRVEPFLETVFLGSSMDQKVGS